MPSIESIRRSEKYVNLNRYFLATMTDIRPNAIGRFFRLNPNFDDVSNCSPSAIIQINARMRSCQNLERGFGNGRGRFYRSIINDIRTKLRMVTTASKSITKLPKRLPPDSFSQHARHLEFLSTWQTKLPSPWTQHLKILFFALWTLQ